MEVSRTYFLDILERMYEHVTYYNNMSPFPIYDTEYVNDLKELIEKMKETKEEYNDLPVYFCTHCKSLHIEVDEQNNDICHRCGAVNEIAKLANIEEYNNKYSKIWE